LIKEGLLSAKIDPQQELLISIPQEALLRRWPRLWELLSQDRRFLRMRERLDASMKHRITHGRQREDFLDGGFTCAKLVGLAARISLVAPRFSGLGAYSSHPHTN
jgi:hypothetical protein